jgi:hypothetical protein
VELFGPISEVRVEFVVCGDVDNCEGKIRQRIDHAKCLGRESDIPWHKVPWVHGHILLTNGRVVSVDILRSGILVGNLLFDDPPDVRKHSYSIRFEIQTNPPEIGIPEEARRQKMIHDDSHGTIAQLLGDTLDSVTVRYFSNIWTNQEQVSDYVLGMLADKRTETYSWQVWSQLVGEPEIDCLLTFKNHRQGRLLVWGTAVCLRDEKGRWWFVNVFDYFHLKNPRGTRILSHENLQQP